MGPSLVPGGSHTLKINTSPCENLFGTSRGFAVEQSVFLLGKVIKRTTASAGYYAYDSDFRMWYNDGLDWREVTGHMRVSGDKSDARDTIVFTINSI